MPEGTNDQGVDRRTVLKTVAAGSAVAVAGCAGDGGEPPAGDSGGDGGDSGGDGMEPEGGERGSWIGVQASEAPNYNVFRVTDTTSSARITRVQDPAYSLDEEDSFTARLIRDYEVNDDFTEFTFTVTDQAEWSDPYSELTAEDFVYSINNVILGEDNWASAPMVDDWQATPEGEDEAVDLEVEQTGEYEFTVGLPAPDPAFIRKPILWGFQAVAPIGLLEPYVQEQDGDGLNQDEEIQSLSYTGNLGAYDVEVLETEARMYATRDDEYYLSNYEGYEDAPRFDDWTYQVMREESTRLSALQAGDITSAGIPPRRRQEFVDNEDIQVVNVPTPFVSSIIYQHRGNGSWNGWEDAAVRRAFTRATDVPSIVEDILNGAGQPAYTYQPEWSEFYDDSEVTPIEYDPERAREELENNLPDGYHYEDDVLIDEESGEQLVLKYVYASGSDDVELTARFLQNEYEEILGVGMELEAVPFNTLLGEYLQVPNAAEAREFDMLAGIGTNTYPRTPTATNTFWDPATNTVLGAYPDPQGVSDLFAEASSSTDMEERQQLIAEAFGILSEEQPFNFLYFSDDIYGYQDNVEFSEEPSLAWGYDINRWQFSEE